MNDLIIYNNNYYNVFIAALDYISSWDVVIGQEDSTVVNNPFLSWQKCHSNTNGKVYFRKNT